MTLQEVASASAMIKTELAPVFEKIGQGAEWTFEIFVRQAIAEAFMNMLWIIPGIMSFVFAKKCYEQLKEANEYEQFPWFIGFAGLLAFGLVATLFPIAGLIQVFVNPEYAAIKLIIETVQGVK